MILERGVETAAVLFLAQRLACNRQNIVTGAVRSAAQWRALVIPNANQIQRCRRNPHYMRTLC